MLSKVSLSFANATAVMRRILSEKEEVERFAVEQTQPRVLPGCWKGADQSCPWGDASRTDGTSRPHVHVGTYLEPRSRLAPT